MDKIKITVITVCYNAEKTIERTLLSVLGQTCKNYEYVIIDGNSKDKTIDIIRQYEVLFDGRMQFISEPDKGIYDAMNKGINMATGQLIGIINSDDYYERDALQNMYTAYDPSVMFQVLYGFQRCVTDGKEEKIVIFNHEFIDKQMITHPTCFVTKAVYDRFGSFDLLYKSSADYELMLRLYHSTETKFTPVYKVISNFESGGMSSSEIGVRETAKLRFEYGIISKMRFHEIMMRSRIHNFLNR